MNTLKYSMVVTVVFSTVNITACETIASYLPDKEKDYSYHEELPPLELPPDLKNKAEKKQQGSDASKSRVERVKSDVAAISTDPVSVRIVKYDAGSVRIQIDSSLKEAWPVVGKAISRNTIEITDRNRDEGVYFVQYDPDFEKYEDGTISDEFDFVFGDDPRQAKEYHVRLAEDGKLTEVMVADENDIPLSEGDGLKLLNTLYETIKADQKKKTQE